MHTFHCTFNHTLAIKQVCAESVITRCNLCSTWSCDPEHDGKCLTAICLKLWCLERLTRPYYKVQYHFSSRIWTHTSRKECCIKLTWCWFTHKNLHSILIYAQLDATSVDWCFWPFPCRLKVVVRLLCLEAVQSAPLKWIYRQSAS